MTYQSGNNEIRKSLDTLKLNYADLLKKMKGVEFAMDRLGEPSPETRFLLDMKMQDLAFTAEQIERLLKS